MSNKVNQDEIIGQFRDGELNNEKTSLFEKELKMNSSLKKNYELHGMVDNALQEYETDPFIQKLEKIHEQMLSKDKNVFRVFFTRNRLILAAASLLILASLSFLLIIQSGNKLSSETIAGEIYAPYEAVSVTRSASTFTDSNYLTFANVIGMYNNQNYVEAIPGFLDLTEKDIYPVMSQLCLGVSYFETGQFENALDAFQMVVNSNDLLYIQQGNWYKAITLLRMNRLEESKTLFLKISEGKGYYKNKAIAVLEDINNME